MQLTPDQLKAVDHLAQNTGVLLVGKMGAGKTAISLAALDRIAREKGITRALVVAPVNVCKTVWVKEPELMGANALGKPALCVGAPKKRIFALHQVLGGHAKFLVINYENLAWLLRTAPKAFAGAALIFDECTVLKSGKGPVFKAARLLAEMAAWRVGLTGTPVSEDWEGLFGQLRVLDLGASLGRYKTHYYNRYFRLKHYSKYDYELLPGAAEAIAEAISKSVYTLPDYTKDLAPPKFRKIKIPSGDNSAPLSAKIIKLGIATVDGETIIADSAAVVSAKLEQLTQGFIYYADAQYKRLNSLKLNTLLTITSAAKSPILVCYWFGADLDALTKALPLAEVFGKRPPSETVRDWNDGKTDILLLHPKSGGPGLNLADGGHHIIWYSIPWSRFLWEQTNARLWRRGQKEKVLIEILCQEKSIDEVKLARIEKKGDWQLLLDELLGNI